MVRIAPSNSPFSIPCKKYCSAIVDISAGPRLGNEFLIASVSSRWSSLGAALMM